MLQQVRQPLIFMGEIEKVITCLPIVYWHWMQKLVKGFGTFKPSIMIFGTEIFLPHLIYLPLLKKVKKLM